MNLKCMIFVWVHITRQNIVCTKNHETFRRILGNNEVTGSDVIVDINGAGSVFQCIGNCESDNHCWSVGYKNDGDVCRLISTKLDDSDVDGADLGWTYFVMTGINGNHIVDHQKSFYYFGDTVKRLFNDSQAICNKRGGHVVTIESSEENNFILDILAKKESVKEIWIGCSDELKEGAWTWLPSMTPLAYTFWRRGQPDGGYDQNCAVLHKGGYTSYRWHDVPCDRKCIFICEKSFF